MSNDREDHKSTTTSTAESSKQSAGVSNIPFSKWLDKWNWPQKKEDMRWALNTFLVPLPEPAPVSHKMKLLQEALLRVC